MVSEKNTKAEIYKVYEDLIKKAYAEDLDIPGDVETLTAKDTKSVLLDAVDELYELLGDGYDEYEQVSFDTQTIKEQFEKAEMPDSSRAESTAHKENETNVSKSKFVLGKSIDILNADILDKIRAVEDTVNKKREILANLNLLEKELSSFIDTINSDRKKYSDTVEFNRQKLETLKQNKQEELDGIKTDSQEKIDFARQKIENMKREIDEKRRLRDENRKGEEEQYEYDQKVQMSREDDAWEDRRSRREQTILAINDTIKSLREELKSKEENVQSLQSKLEQLPHLLEQAQKEGAESIRKEMEEENNHRTELAKRSAVARFEELEHMLDNLKKDYDERICERDDLRIKLDKAYEESNKLYLQTVQSTGGIKILGGREKS